MKISNAMIAVMTLMVPRGGSKDVEMALELSSGKPLLRVEIEGNIRAWFEPVYD